MANLTPGMEAMTIARIAMLLKQPFFGTLAMKLQLIECDESMAEKMRTAAVDGRRMWFNPEFVLSLSKDELIFLMCHEVMHCVFNHLGRRGSRDPKIYNMAADYVINAALINENFVMPEVGLYEKKYFNWTAEDVYDELIKNGEDGQGGSQMDLHPGDPG